MTKFNLGYESAAPVVDQPRQRRQAWRLAWGQAWGQAWGMKLGRTISLLLVLLAGAKSADCVTPQVSLQRFEFQEIHMGTRVRMILYAQDEPTAARVSRAAMARIGRLDLVCSDYRNDSELTRFVEASGQGMVDVDPDLYQILALSQSWSQQTDGLFDVTMAPVVQLWRRARRTRELPDPARLAAARQLVGIRHLTLDAGQSLRPRAGLARPGMRVDLGGIAKGYAAQEALAELARHGIPRALVAIGGDIAVGQPPPGENGWRIDVAPLAGTKGKPELQLSLREAAVSTSGDAEQAVVIDGVRYSHIVDPRTGIGLRGQRSVTVVASHGATADALATTLCILGAERAMKLVARLVKTDRRLAARYVDPDRAVVSKGWASHLTLPNPPPAVLVTQ